MRNKNTRMQKLKAIALLSKQLQQCCCSSEKKTLAKVRPCCNVQLRTKDKQRATPCKECLQRKEPPKIKSGFCCVQSNERVRINAPVIRSERSVIIVSQHQLQWPPDDPKARNHAQHFDNVILGATRKSAVVSEFWREFEVL
jgi:hypothetical protein